MPTRATPLFASAATLLRMRQLSEATMPHRAAVFRAIKVTKPGAVVSITYGTTPADGLDAVPCRLAPAAAPAEAVAADALRAASRFELALPYGTPILVDDRITVTHAIEGVASPVTLKIIGPIVRSIEMHRAVLCEVVR